jgi:hypothetical protein
MRRTVQLTVVALLATSCAQSGGTPLEADGSSATATLVISPLATAPSADPYLPTYPSMEVLPAAQMGGRLVLEDGCLWLKTPEYRALPLWPADSRVEREGDTVVVINSGRSRAEVGTDVIGGGGEYTAEHYDFVVELIGKEIPPACRGDGYYWLVYGVEAADQ